jgi:hypothetical protein
MDSPVWPVLKVLVWTLVALHALVTLLSWVLTIRTLGVASLKLCPRMIFLSGRGWPVIERVLLLTAPFAIIRFLNSLGLGPGTFNVFPLNAFMLMAVMIISLPLIPPTAVVFSNSTDRQLRWALALKQLAGGRRVISMLDTSYLKRKRTIRDSWSIFTRRAITVMDILRTTETEDWHYLVQQLVAVTPIVIVDTRVFTHALLFEASTVMTPEYAHKAIFISDDDGSCPVLQNLVADGTVPLDLRISVVKQDELGPILKRLVRSPHTLPQYGTFPVPPIRVAECVQGGLHQERVFQSALPDSDESLAEIELTMGKFELSTSLTPLLKLAGLVYWLIILMFLVFGPLVLEQAQPAFVQKLGTMGWLALLCGGFLTGVFTMYVIRSLREVHLLDDYILVSDRGKEIKIHPFDIAHVSGPDWTSLRKITIHLHRPSAFGKKISFVPRLFEGSLIATMVNSLAHSRAVRNSIVKSS